ncbi:hypothetical protein ONE63_005967 [Megalurothrips usitatus]|uniref:Uncharacterized protein n=1 Tax=Megalurothrips usitatus TaxID=439358 RepID=A0AAV7XRW4_9NEOP|nr:hypothetical protein ONE63_005967 [Megalurothrips usitatus]
MQLALGGRDSVLESVLTCLLQRVQSIVNYSPAALDSKVGVSLVSDHRHHLQSAILSEVAAPLRQISTSVRAHPLPALEDEAVRNKQCASVLSAGVHVGRSTMMERRALASLTVVF